MKFNDMPYFRVEHDEFKERYDDLTAELASADSAEAALKVFDAEQSLLTVYRTMTALSYIRYTMDTTDEFYKKENDYYDEMGPHFNNLSFNFNKVLLLSKHRAQMERQLSPLLFTNLEMEQSIFDPSIIPELQEEARLYSRYTELVASAQIEFEGETLNLPQLGFFMQSADRDERRRAFLARSGFFALHLGEFDKIFDGLVSVRDAMAKKLGFKNYVEMGYLRMTRNCYGPEDVERFRGLVQKYVTPLAVRLAEKQRKRIGADKLLYYDLDFHYPAGNPMPQGTPEELMQAGLDMYRELSPDTSEFFAFLLENDLLDLLTRPSKASGGYCSYLLAYKSPFIFANFNGTSSDVDVLTHEAGHALASYLARDIYPVALQDSTYELAEVHSMSMELLTWPYMDKFFGADADNYRRMHLATNSVYPSFGCLIDEFQHIIYERPELSPVERRGVWSELEVKYMPHVDYADDEYMKNGGACHRILHMFGMPFYYIDYCLAQYCALSIWHTAEENREDALTRYIKLCRMAGKSTFLEAIKECGIDSPFEEESMKKLTTAVEAWLSEH